MNEHIELLFIFRDLLSPRTTVEDLRASYNKLKRKAYKEQEFLDPTRNVTKDQDRELLVKFGEQMMKFPISEWIFCIFSLFG